MGHKERGVICGCFGPCPECEPRPDLVWLPIDPLTQIQLPKINATYPQLLASDIVSVQPMNPDVRSDPR